MEIINKCLSGKDFKKYIENKKVKRKINKIVLHHTWDKTSEWRNKKVSCNYYKKLYEKKGWKSGPHLFTAPEGIWLFSDIGEQGTHANLGNKGSIGIEMVGRYDAKVPSGVIWKNTKIVLKTLLEKFNLKKTDIHFHREFNLQKSCPGKAITKKWVRSQI
jgi:hypothetical protein